MRTIFTSPLSKENPRSTEILYNWPRRAMRTTMSGLPQHDILNEEALLIRDHGFSIIRKTKTEAMCSAGLPGIIRPDWLDASGCSCEALIVGLDPLTS